MQILLHCCVGACDWHACPIGRIHPVLAQIRAHLHALSCASPSIIRKTAELFISHRKMIIKSMQFGDVCMGATVACANKRLRPLLCWLHVGITFVAICIASDEPLCAHRFSHLCAIDELLTHLLTIFTRTAAAPRLQVRPKLAG